MSDSKFQGFRCPQSNYFRLPNEWSDITAKIKSLAELKVVEYVLRHTWGFQEYGLVKRITLEEFRNGRKTKDGERIDSGTGLSEPSIIDGIKRAVGHGLLEVQTIGTDKARIKKLYGLRMVVEEDLRIFTPDLKKNKDRPIDSLGRTEKDTLERDTMSPPTDGDSSPVSSSPNKKNPPVKFDYTAADKLHEVITSHRKITGKYEREKWAREFRLMREYDKIDKKTIREAIQWYAKHIGEKYVPEAFCGNSFRRKFVKFLAAMERARQDNGEGPTLTPRQKQMEEFSWRIVEVMHANNRYHECYALDSEIAEVEKQMGLPAGSVKRGDFSL